MEKSFGIAGAALVLVSLLSPSAAAVEEPLPIFDAHMHYSQSAWEVFDPKAVIGKMDAAGVSRALVSSTPDDGTLMLGRAGAGRIIPELRPYRTRGDMASWHADADVLAYMERRLAARPYVGVGEFHLVVPDHVKTPQVRRLMALAVERGLVLHVHADARVVRALLTAEPRLKVLWAHAGFSEPVPVITETLDDFPDLMADLSYRAAQIIGADGLDGAWRRLLIQHADRFMVGTDTWTVDRWDAYVGLIDEHRQWLRRLPSDAAHKIAHGNARRYFKLK